MCYLWLICCCQSCKVWTVFVGEAVYLNRNTVLTCRLLCCKIGIYDFKWLYSFFFFVCVCDFDLIINICCQCFEKEMCIGRCIYSSVWCSKFSQCDQCTVFHEIHSSEKSVMPSALVVVVKLLIQWSPINWWCSFKGFFPEECRAACFDQQVTCDGAKQVFYSMCCRWNKGSVDGQPIS